MLAAFLGPGCCPCLKALGAGGGRRSGSRQIHDKQPSVPGRQEITGPRCVFLNRSSGEAVVVSERLKNLFPGDKWEELKWSPMQPSLDIMSAEMAGAAPKVGAGQPPEAGDAVARAPAGGVPSAAAGLPTNITCRICHRVLESNEAMEVHLRTCSETSETRQACARCDVELETHLELADEFMRESMQVMLCTAIGHFERHAGLVHVVKHILKRAMAVGPDSDSAGTVLQGLHHEVNILLVELNAQAKDAKDLREAQEAQEAVGARRRLEPLGATGGSGGGAASSVSGISGGSSGSGPTMGPTGTPQEHLPLLIAILTKVDTVLKHKSELLGSPKAKAAVGKDNSSVTISDFQFLKVLSQGGSAKVYLARRRGSDELFAVKVMSKVYIKDMKMQRYVIQERRILSMPGEENPFTIKLYFAFTSEEYLFFVMEYVAGGDFQTLLNCVNRMSESMARHYIAELVLSIEFFHSRGVVHRDIKPDNLLMTSEGHIKLVDFGLSKQKAQPRTQHSSPPSGGNENETSTRSGATDPAELTFRPYERDDKLYSPVGTNQYVAPEVILGMGHDECVDWWSLGVLLFQFLSGSLPFDDPAPEKIYENILTNNVQWPLGSSPGPISPVARDLIIKLICFQPVERLGSNGAGEVKLHPFFAGVEWDNLFSKPAPIVPQLTEDQLSGRFNSQNSLQPDVMSSTPRSSYTSHNTYRSFSYACDGVLDGSTHPGVLDGSTQQIS